MARPYCDGRYRPLLPPKSAHDPIPKKGADSRLRPDATARPPPAGFTCCGKNMKLYRFVSCLSPKPSRDLWIITQWVRDPPSHQRVCGWPDCGAYVPICCTHLLPGGEGLRWHCVICQGNSMDCERDLRSTQIRFPYLPGGQPALTPSS